MLAKFSFAVSLALIGGISWCSVQNADDAPLPPNSVVESSVQDTAIPQQPQNVQAVQRLNSPTVTLPQVQALPPTEIRVPDGHRMAARSVNLSGNLNPENHFRQMELQQAVAQYKQADNAEARQREQENIAAILGAHYDSYLKSQEEQIQQLEERVVKLREQFDRRRDAKQRLLELKLEMIISQAEGLGWPGDPQIPTEPLDDISRFFLENSNRHSIPNRPEIADRFQRRRYDLVRELPTEPAFENVEKVPISETIVDADGNQQTVITGYRIIKKSAKPAPDAKPK